MKLTFRFTIESSVDSRESYSWSEEWSERDLDGRTAKNATLGKFFVVDIEKSEPQHWPGYGALECIAQSDSAPPFVYTTDRLNLALTVELEERT